MPTVIDRPIALTGHDLYLFREGTHTRLYEKLGAHVLGDGTQFAVWAPNAAQVAVIGDFNNWDPRAHPMRGSDAGIWTAKVPGAKQGSLYKFHVVSKSGNYTAEKFDPYAFRSEMPPRLEAAFPAARSRSWMPAQCSVRQCWMQPAPRF